MARGLYDNINARKKAGTSRSKSESTISPAAYKNMQEGFPMKDRKKKMGGGSMMESPRKAMAMGGYGESTKRKKCATVAMPVAKWSKGHAHKE
jgi:hypothetical protein